MATQKGGTIFIKRDTKQIALIVSRDTTYTFPKGHLEEGETLKECALRETEEETLRAVKLLSKDEIGIVKYTTPNGEDVELYMYVAEDIGPTEKEIAPEDREVFVWVDFDKVEKTLTFDDLKVFWRSVKDAVYKYFN